MYFRTVSEAVAAARRSRHRPVPPRRRGRAGHRSRRRRDGVTLRGHRRQATPSTVDHDGDPPDLFKRRRAGGRARATSARRARTRVRVRPDPDQARQRLHAAEGRHRQGQGVVTAALVKAALGYAALAIGAGACDRRHQRAASPGSACATRCSCGSVAAACSSCSAPRSLAAGRHGVGAAQPRLLDPLRRREQRARHAAAVHDHRAVGRARGIDPAVGR